MPRGRPRKQREQEQESEEEDQEYEVERIEKARVIKKGRKLTLEFYVKWKGYETEDDTWEPEDSFVGSAEEILEKFCERIRLQDLKPAENPDNFKHGQEILPTGPPRRQKSTSNIKEAAAPTKPLKPARPSKKRTMETVETVESSSPPPRKPAKPTRPPKPARPESDSDIEFIEVINTPSTSPQRPTRKRERAQSSSRAPTGRDVEEGPSAKRKRVVSEKAKPVQTAPKRRGRPPKVKSPIPTVEDSDADAEGEEDTEIVALDAAGPSTIENNGQSHDDLFGSEDVQMATEEHPSQEGEVIPDSTEPSPPPVLPVHRARAANPRVKRLEDEGLQKSLNGAISTKARAIHSPTEVAAAGPSQTSASASPVKTGPPKKQPSSIATRKASLLTFNKGGPKTLKRGPKVTESSTIMDTDVIMVDTPTPEDALSAAGPSSQPEQLPSGQELLALAGHNEADANDLPDFDEEAAAAQAVEPAPVQEQPAVVVNQFAGFKAPEPSMFSPLTMATPKEEQPDDASLPPLRLFLSPHQFVPIEPKDVTPPKIVNGETIDIIMKNFRRLGERPAPGKFYTQGTACMFPDALHPTKSHARVVPHESANPAQRAMFQSFSVRLTQGGTILTTTINKGVLFYYASTNKELVQKFNVPDILRGLVDTVLVSHHEISDTMKWALVATDFENIRW